MDALSDVLRAVRLTGAVFFDIQAAEPWVAATPAGRSIVERIFPGTEHLIPYHAITRGRCWIGVAGEQPVMLEAGDIVVVPHGDEHVLSSAPGLRAKADMTVYRRPTDRALPFTVTMGKAPAEATTQIVCGYLGCDARPFNPLLAALPRMIKVANRAGGELATYLRFARRGSVALGARRAFRAVRRPPMQYLTSWRMQLAANELATGGASVAAVASRAGYGSEAAFSRAFKKAVGAPPGEWRTRKRVAG